MPSPTRHDITHSQNFLKDSRLIAALLDQSSIGRDDVVYEIGPGQGIITQQLARRCQKVVAIEKDPDLATLLLQRFTASPNVVIRQGDFLHYDLPRQPYKVFANIPFNMTSAILVKLTEAACPPEDAYLGMQKEAADRFLGRPHECLRSVLLKPWFELAVVYRFRRQDFVPVPQVDTVLLRLRKRGPPLVKRQDRQRFRDFVVYGFTTWRPTLGDILQDVFTRRQLTRISNQLDMNLNTTPTAVRFEQWLALFAYLKEIGAMYAVWGSERQLVQQQRRLQKIHRTRRYGKR